MPSNRPVGPSAIRCALSYRILAAFTLGFGGASSTDAFVLPAYHVVDLSGHIALAGTVSPVGINDFDQVVGQLVTATNTRGFVHSNGTTTLLAPLPTSSYDHSSATAINSSGQIVGYSDDLGIPKAVYWANPSAVPQNLDSGGGPDANAYATGINDQTTITGFFTSSGSGNTKSWTAVKWQPDPDHPDRFRFTKLDTPVAPLAGVPAGAFDVNETGQIIGSGATDVTELLQGPLRWNATDLVTPLETLPTVFTLRYDAVAINDSSIAVGRYVTTAGAEHALQWNADGSIVDLASPADFAESSALDVNNTGLIVGHAKGPAGTTAFLHLAGGWLNLNSRLIDGAGWWLESATAINDRGVIVGTGVLDGAARAFLLEPASLPPGDYNANGTVDAADYIFWRHSLGQTGPLQPADGNGNGVIDEADYDVWRAHFGQTIAQGSLQSDISVAVPEQTARFYAVLALMAAAAGLRRGHKK